MTEEQELMREIKEEINYLADVVIAIRRSTFSSAKKRQTVASPLSDVIEAYK